MGENPPLIMAKSAFKELKYSVSPTKETKARPESKK